MAYLPLANILHHRLRSALSALGIGVAVCMSITLAGLSRGSLNEAVGRWNGVKADLIAYPGSTNLTMAYGAAITQKAVGRILELRDDQDRPVAQRVVPAYLARFEVEGADQNVFGIRAEDFDVFGGPGEVLRGRLPDPQGAFSQWLSDRFAAAAGTELAVTDDEIRRHGGLEIAIDDRLARRIAKDVGDDIYIAGRPWRVVGVFRSGAISRAFVPMRALQYLASAQIDRVTLLFVVVSHGVTEASAIRTIQDRLPLQVVPRREYQGMLMQSFSTMYTYVDTVNALALGIAFLFIMVTLYTMVLQRTREIAILKSMGASRGHLVRQVLEESVLLTTAGAAAGVTLAFAAGWAIQRIRPDLTVTITPGWIAAALAAAGVGSLLAGAYPAWRAARVDVAETLSLE